VSRKYPLEIVLRHTGTAELIDANDITLWSSDGDEDFRETVTDEFVKEEDTDDLLHFLVENKYLKEAEAKHFETGEWDVTEESLEGDEDVSEEGDSEDDGDEEDESDDEEENE
jgi:hypothetical protein